MRPLTCTFSQGIRAFSRFFLLIYPFLYGSYYGYIARETNFALGVCLALIGSIALCAILNEGIGLEDPFLPSRTFLNDIRVKVRFEALFQTYNRSSPGHVTGTVEPCI